MRSLQTWVVRATSVACAAALLAPLSASAEGFLDLYAGMTFTTDDNTTIDTGPPVFGVATLRDDTRFDPALTGGGRLGWWAESASWLGVALDVSYLRPEEDGGMGKDLETRLLPVSALFMARYPLLASDDAPNGILQPYLALGPSFIFSKASFEIGNGRFDDRQFDFGFDGRAGLSVLFGEHVGLFAEYRFLYFRADYDDGSLGTEAQAEVQHLSNGVVGGITLRFGGPDD